MTMVFVLGAADPEMEEIERVLRENGYEVRYACHRWAHSTPRVRADNAYSATDLDAPIPRGAQLVFVECEVIGLPRVHVVDHHRPGDPGYNQPPSEYLYSSSLGQVLQLLGLTPTPQQRVIAAADHCPTQAYQGQCPGVNPQELAYWRTLSRAARRGVTAEEMDKAILEAAEMLRNAERIDFCGETIAWMSDRKGEITEASARHGIPFMYMEPMPDGRVKMGIMGAQPHVIEAWMNECGLNQVYGDPARGYAGGYR